MNESEYILKIILRARDETAKVLRAVRTELSKFDKEIKQTQKDVAALNRSLDAFERRWSRLAGNIDKAKRSAADFASGQKTTAQEVDRTSRSIKKQVEETDELIDSQTKAHKSVEVLTQEYKKLTREYQQGKRSRDDVIFGLDLISKELDKLAKKHGVAEELGFEINRMSVQIKRTLNGIVEAEREAARQRNAIREEIRRREARAEREADQERRRRQREQEREAEKAQQRQIRAGERRNEQIRRQQRLDRQREEERLALLRRAEQAAAEVERLSDERNTHGISRTALAAQFNSLRRELTSATRHVRLGSDEFNRYSIAAQDAQNNIIALRREVRESGNDIVGADRNTRGFIGTLNDWEHSLSAVGENVAAFDNRMRGMALLLGFLLIQPLATALLSIAGGFAAVASSAAMAASAVAGFATAAAAQAAPAIGILIASLIRVEQVMDAVQQFDAVQEQTATRQTQRATQIANATDAVANANDTLRSANQSLADAHRTAGLAQERLTDARREARREIEDLIIAEREAELAARGASLSHKEALEEFRRAVSEGRVQDIEQARLRVQQTRLAQEQASVELRRARADSTRGRRGGVEGTDRVRDARRAVEEAARGVQNAERSVVRANRGLQSAQRRASEASQDTFAAAEKLNYLLAQLSPAERRLYNAIRRFRDVYDETFRGVTDIIIGSFVRSVNRSADLLRNPRLLGSARRFAQEMSRQMNRAFDAFTSPRMIAQMERIAAQGRENLRPLTTIAIRLGRALFNIAEAAGPSLRRVILYFADLSGKILELTNNRSRLSRFFEEGTNHFLAWMRMLEALVGMFAALIGTAAPTGLSMVESFTRTLNNATRYINENREEFAEFFEQAREGLDIILNVLVELAKHIFEVFDVGTLRSFANFLTMVFIPALQWVVETAGAAFKIFFDFLTLPGVRELAKLAFGFLFLASIVNGIVGIFAFLLHRVSTFIGLIGNLARALRLVPRGTAVFGGMATSLGRVQSGLGKVVSSIGLLIARIPGLRRLGAVLQGIGTRAQAAGTAAGAGAAAAGAGARGAAGGGRRLLRGAGAAAIVGMLVPSIGGDRRLTESPNRAINQVEGTFNRVVGGLGRLGSLDLGGAFRQLTRNNKEIQEFGKNYDSLFRKFRDQRNANALRQQARQARELADEWPEYRKELEKAAEQSESAAKKIEDLNRALRPLGRNRFAFQRLGFNVEDILPGQENAVSQFISNIRRMNTVGVDSITDLRNNMRFNMQRIKEGFVEGSQSAADAMSKNFSEGIEAIRKGMRNGTISTKEGMSEIHRLTRRAMRLSRSDMTTMSAEGRENMARSFRSARLAVVRQMGGIENATQDGLRTIRRLMREELRAYGITGRQASNYIRSRTNERFEGTNPWGGREEGRRARGGIIGRAAGGLLGMAGERGKDLIPTMLGRGEMVLNHFHQRYIDPAVQWFYGHPLTKTFDRIRGFHAGGPDTPGFKGFAGGYAGRSPSGYRTVPIPGFPGEFIAARVLRDALNLIRRFRLHVTDAFATSGHSGPGHLRYGTAMDVVPGRGGSWDLVDRAVAYARSRGLTVLYNGVPGHGRGHHAHIELRPGAVAGGRMPFIAGDARANIPIVGIRGGGGDSALRAIANRGLLRVRDAANARVQRIIDQISGDVAGEGGYTPGHAPRGSISRSEALRIFRRAFEIALPFGRHRRMQPGWLGNLLNLAMEESSLRPGITNNTAAGRANGTPQGILQVTIPTFRAHSLPGYTNPFNPLHNAIASIRYQLSRYGHIRRHAPYAMGGIVGKMFQEGSPVPILAHAGEWVLNKWQQSRVAGMLGMSREMLRDKLGFTGGRGSYQGGGEIGLDEEQQPDRMFTTESARQRLQNIRRGIYRLPAIPLRSVQEVVTEFRRLFVALERVPKSVSERTAKRRKEIEREIDKLERGEVTRKERQQINKLKDELRNLNNKARGDLFIANIRQGIQLLESLRAARERATQQLDRRTTFRVFRLNRRTRTVTRRLTEPQEAALELENAQQNLINIQREYRALIRLLRRVNRRLRRLRRGGIDREEAKEYADLVAVQQNLRDGLADIRTQEAESIKAIYEAQINQQQQIADSINNRYERTFGAMEAQEQIFQALGDDQAIERLNQARIGLLKNQQRELLGMISRARGAGAEELAQQLEAQVNDINVQIVNLIQANLQSTIERINERAQRRLGRLDMAERMIQAIGGVGLGAVASLGGETFSRAGIFQARGQVLAQQRAELQNMLNRMQRGPLAERNLKAIQDLTDQLVELDVTIQENSRALFQARIDEVNSNAEFATQVNDLTRQIAEIEGELSGSGQNNPRLIQIARNQDQVLQTQRAGLQALLNEASRRGDQQATRDLTIQLLQNELAIKQNTKSIRELEGAMTEPQTFSSTAWQLFRQAIFNGMGGLLPQYQIPAAQTGAFVRNSGMVMVHAGEEIRPASITQFGNGIGPSSGDKIDITINEAGERVNTEYLAKRIMWEKNTSGRVR